MSNYLEGLNEPQKEAVLYNDGPIMIIAGAGSGKTRVLTYKIAYLLEQGYEPFSILALTFTNKAAREMRERIEHVIGPEAKNLWMGTFHSIFARILRYEAEKLGYQSNFTIYDTEDAKSVISGVIKDMKLDDKLYKVNSVMSRISSAKNNLISWRSYENKTEYRIEDEASGRPKVFEIYKEYALRCFRANAMDFDDLLFNTNVLFHKHPDVLNKYQHRFKYVMIDEFQDTNVSQYMITKKLCAVHQRICIVGDDAQSIYAFRGANIQNILNFEHDYPDVRVIKLEQNYRSTQTIVEAANSVIRHNRHQLKKKVWTSNVQGSLIDLIRSTNDSEEARNVATSIYEEHLRGTAYKDIAILYRTNSQSRAIEESLRRTGIRYKIIGGLSFYQRKEIKDMIAYLRFTLNTADTESFKRIVNYPKRGIGLTTVNKLLVTSHESGQPVWMLLQNIRSLFSGNTASLLERFRDMVKAFQMFVAQKDAYEAASAIAKNSGLLKELYEDRSVEGKVRYDNLQELFNAIKAFVEDPDKTDKSLTAFLQEVALITSSDEQEQENAVTLMTVHMSKGLEFDYVYLVGMEENLFPSQLMLENSVDLEEERRLFYVAVTRAKKKLYLTFALQRYRFGKLIMAESSRFIDEIDQQYISRKALRGDGMSTPQSFRPSGFVREFASEEFQAEDPDNIEVGMRVRHLKFGEGSVESISKDGMEIRAKVLFDEVGEKTLLLNFAKLMIIPIN